MTRAYLIIFLRGASIVTLTAANTGQIAGQHYPGALMVGYAISWVWFTNARAAAHTDLPYAREVYAIGAMVGTGIGMLITRELYGH